MFGSEFEYWFPRILPKNVKFLGVISIDQVKFRLFFYVPILSSNYFHRFQKS